MTGVYRLPLFDKMSAEQSGFTVEQLVIYKLGQIETQLSNISNEIKEFNKSQADQDAEIKSVKNQVNKLETNYRVDRARLLTLAGVVALVIGIAKEVLEKWIGSLYLH